MLRVLSQYVNERGKNISSSYRFIWQFYIIVSAESVGKRSGCPNSPFSQIVGSIVAGRRASEHELRTGEADITFYEE